MLIKDTLGFDWGKGSKSYPEKRPVCRRFSTERPEAAGCWNKHLLDLIGLNSDFFLNTVCLNTVLFLFFFQRCSTDFSISKYILNPSFKDLLKPFRNLHGKAVNSFKYLFISIQSQFVNMENDPDSVYFSVDILSDL